jgi:hypothetical protein
VRRSFKESIEEEGGRVKRGKRRKERRTKNRIRKSGMRILE